MPPDIAELVEQLAGNAHDRWAACRISEGLAPTSVPRP
ncbi:hypothetical protein KV110_24730 [Nocardia iowensis]|uniref:Uncharacterized protein n=1 Tax=Nocardia iowensis TaxID=204891 RepID=A0ABX8S158_NOCIO|nr:hypothetical protein KV110_24730 [Nocardia iowensis]